MSRSRCLYIRPLGAGTALIERSCGVFDVHVCYLGNIHAFWWVGARGQSLSWRSRCHVLDADHTIAYYWFLKEGREAHRHHRLNLLF